MVAKGSAFLALVLVSAAASGCVSVSPGGDNAGGPVGGPVVLQMASTAANLSFVLPVADFVRRVNALSGGTLRIKVINQWGNYAPDAEVQAVRAVAIGTADLGWAGSRVFDSMGPLGAPSLRALSAPMLIDSYPLENAVLQSAITGRMLAGLKSAGLTGLGVLGDGLRLPISASHPLLAPADWRGILFGTYRSQTQQQGIRALGATGVSFSPFRSHDLDSGEIQGFELDVQGYAKLGLATKAPYVAANVALWPQFDILFANPGLLASLTGQQRAWLEHAAKDTTRDSVRLASRTSPYIRKACMMGARFVNATSADLAALRGALSVVYQQMKHDPQTSAFIRQIQRLKKSTAPGPALRIPTGCTRKP